MVTDPPHELELDPNLDSDLANFQRRVFDKNWEETLAKEPRSLPPDLRALERQIRTTAMWCTTKEVELGHPVNVGYPFDGYEVYRCMRGGMGMVLEAWNPELKRKEALKLWIDRDADDMLVREAQTLARLRHPNVVTVYGTGTWKERRYFKMEWIDGQDADDWLGEPGSRTWREILDLYLAAGNGLAAAHDEKIHHRDFKPSNVLVGDDGRVYVADFGIADTMRSAERQKVVDYLAGTTSFMALERLRGREGDALSDQFSFCVALWYSLHDRMPYRGRTREALALAMEDYAITPVARGSTVPRWLRRIVRRGLHPDPEQRYGSMHELLAALKREPVLRRVMRGALKSESVTIEPHGALVMGSPWARAGRVLGLSLVGGVTGTLLVFGVVDRGEPSSSPPYEQEAISVDSYERGLAKFAEAKQAATNAEYQRAFHAWNDGQQLIFETDPEHVGVVSLELATQIATRDPGRSFPAWMAERAGKAFETSKNWTRAAEAAREAAKLYREARLDDDANKQDGCAEDYDKQRPCRQSAQPTVPSPLVNGESHH